MPKTKDILVYGDSLTFGKIPGGLRHSRELRFTGVLQDVLGDDYEIIEEGLRGRTVSNENAFFPFRNGLEQFGPIFGSHLPLHLLILFLGTNDINSGSAHTVEQIGESFNEYNSKIIWWCEHLGFEVPKVLLIAPPIVYEEESKKAFGEIFTGAQIKSKQLPQVYENIAKSLNWHFFDSSKVVVPSKLDGVHLDEENNRLLGETLVREVLRLC